MTDWTLCLKHLQPLVACCSRTQTRNVESAGFLSNMTGDHLVWPCLFTITTNLIPSGVSMVNPSLIHYQTITNWSAASASTMSPASSVLLHGARVTWSVCPGQGDGLASRTPKARGNQNCFLRSKQVVDVAQE
jgi:hypothetical protein